VSSTRTPRRAPPAAPLALTRVGRPVDPAVINSAFAQLEQADAANVKRGREPYFPSLLLGAPNGATYRVTVQLAGDGTPSLTLAVVER
jgi:hypothetical protein